jgi:hypothetical protein
MGELGKNRIYIHIVTTTEFIDIQLTSMEDSHMDAKSRIDFSHTELTCCPMLSWFMIPLSPPHVPAAVSGQSILIPFY